MPTPQYILDIRASYGSGLLFLPAVCAVVLHENQVLLVRRTDNGRWSLPAGIMEPGEQPAEALAREVLEETRVEVQVEGLPVLAATDPPVAYGNGDVCEFVVLTYRAQWVAGDPEVGDDESTDVRWFSLDALPPLADREHARLAAALS